MRDGVQGHPQQKPVVRHTPLQAALQDVGDRLSVDPVDSRVMGADVVANQPGREDQQVADQGIGGDLRAKLLRGLVAPISHTGPHLEKKHQWSA